MKIHVKSFFSVLTRGCTTEQILSLPEGSTAVEALKVLAIGPDDDVMILINGKPSNEMTVLSDGDRFTIMPPVSAA